MRMLLASYCILCFIVKSLLMKIILNLDSPYVPRSKCGPVLGDVVGAGASIASTAMTNATNKSIANSQIDAQREENQLNRDYNTQEAEKARQFQQNMMQEQMNYQTQSWRDQQRNALALQVAGARDAGVNPQVLLSGGGASASGGSASAPSGGSAPAASFSSGLSPVPYQAQSPAVAFAQVAQGISSLATAKEKGVNTHVLEKTIESMDVDMSYKQALTSAVKTKELLDKVELKHRDKLLAQQIEKGVVDMATMKEQGKLYAETAKVQDSIKKLNDALANYHGQQYELVKLQVASFAKDFQSMLNVRAAQVKEANANAFLASENAKTVKEMRGWQVGFQQATTELAQCKSYVERNTLWEQVEAKVSELKAMKMMPEQVEQALIKARNENDWFRVNEILAIVNTGVAVVGTATGAYVGTGYVNAANVKNKIDAEYKQFEMTKKVMPHRSTPMPSPWTPYGR